jgi:hypothetical protein
VSLFSRHAWLAHTGSAARLRVDAEAASVVINYRAIA